MQLFTAIFIKYCTKCKSLILKNTTKLFQFSSIPFDSIKKNYIWRVSVLSMTKHFVCKLEVLQPQPSMQGCQFGFFEAKFVIFSLFSTPLAFFYFWKKVKFHLAFFMSIWQHSDFLCRFGKFNDFGRFLDTASGHRMINYHWKLCMRIDNFLFCCFML